MIKTLRYVFLALVALCLVTLAVANRDAVAVRLLPPDLAALAGLHWGLIVPVWLVFFGGVVAGLVLGFVWEWFREHRHRAEASAGKRKVRKLESELAAVKQDTGTQDDEVLALIDKRKAPL
jgi:lipopolysaccharide assembly protein A